MNVHRSYAALGARFRRRRMRWFLAEMTPTSQTRILDVGGCAEFWAGSDCRAQITILNVQLPAGGAMEAGLSRVVGDGRELPFRDGAFDIVFANSVIEHVGTPDDQRRFADEARRVGRRLWIQTPNRRFPVEPHLMTPGVHFLPRRVQRRIVRYATVWGWIARPTVSDISRFFDTLHALDACELAALFPDCRILREHVLGMTKSLVAIR